jgi:hypothetical protein
MATSCADVREMVIEKALYAEVEVVVAVALLNARLANRRQGHTCKEVPLSREKSCFLTEPLFVSRKRLASRWIRTFTARGSDLMMKTLILSFGSVHITVLLEAGKFAMADDSGLTIS